MSSSPQEPTYWPALDGVRGVAVILVVMQHWEVGESFPVDRGLLGVRLFFVLSGFLITGILLSGRGDLARGDPPHVPALSDKLRFAKAFVWRRLLRIAPIYYLTLAVLWVWDAPGFRAEAHWHAAYLTNFLVAGNNGWVGLPSHFWSLAVEEQFYLLWPWVMLWVPRRALPGVLWTTLLVGALWRSVGVHFGLGKFALLYLLPGCLDSLGVGALYALVHREYSGRLRLLRGLSLVLGGLILAIASWVTAGHEATALSHTVAGFKGTGYALVLGALVSVCAAPGGRWVTAFSWGPLPSLGRISYAVYLVHPLIWIALLHGWPTLSSRPAQWAVASVLTLGIAELSRRYIENPINAQKKRYPYPTRRTECALPGTSCS